MLRYNFQLVPVLLGTLIGPLVERHFRQGLTAANGDLTYFISQPIAAGIWIAVLLIVVGLPLLRWWLVWAEPTRTPSPPSNTRRSRAANLLV